jgi:hypothetical protein
MENLSKNIILNGLEILNPKRKDYACPLLGQGDCLFKIGNIICKFDIATINEGGVVFTDKKVNIISGPQNFDSNRLLDIMLALIEYPTFKKVRKYIFPDFFEKDWNKKHFLVAHAYKGESFDKDEATKNCIKKIEELKEQYASVFQFENLLSFSVAPVFEHVVEYYHDVEEGIFRKDNTIYVSEGYRAVVTMSFDIKKEFSPLVDSGVKFMLS